MILDGNIIFRVETLVKTILRRKHCVLNKFLMHELLLCIRLRFQEIFSLMSFSGLTFGLFQVVSNESSQHFFEVCFEDDDLD